MRWTKPLDEDEIAAAAKTRLVVTIENGGALRLTDAGLEYAKKIYERHTILTKCFVALGVDEEVAVNDACRIEHIISDECFAALKQHFAEMGDKAD